VIKLKKGYFKNNQKNIKKKINEKGEKKKIELSGKAGNNC
jgi:hypothetical protein